MATSSKVNISKLDIRCAHLNNRITVKERNLIKGAVRRIFSRSELRKSVLDKSINPCYTDLTRPRVKTWCKCAACGRHEAKSLVNVDHINPVIPTDSALEFMTLDEVADRIWCEENNLQVLCESCHNTKTKAETKIRAKNKKERKLNESKKC